VEHNPDQDARYNILRNRGVLRVLQTKYPEVIAESKEAIRLRPNQYQAYLRVAAVHQLEAMDKGGTVWRVERTLPTPDTSVVSGRQFRLVAGVAHELVTSRAQAQGVSSLKMMFFTEERCRGTLRPR
jgi:hypothetical protein